MTKQHYSDIKCAFWKYKIYIYILYYLAALVNMNILLLLKSWIIEFSFCMQKLTIFSSLVV